MGSKKFKKFLRKSFKAVAPIAGVAIGGPIGGIVGGLVGGESQPAPVYQALPAPPPPPKAKKKASKALEPKMDLVPGVSTKALLIGGATAAGVAVLLAARSK